MAKKNRVNSKRMSVVAQHTMRAVAVIVVAFLMVIVNFLASSSGNQRLKAIGEKERLLAKLENDRMRESARWDEMKTPDRLEKELLRHGLSMKYHKPAQIVRMDRSGVPVSGQLSLARLARETKAVSTASYRKSR